MTVPVGAPFTLDDLEPGDIGFGPITGMVGVFVGAGQLLLGDEARFRHAFVVVEAAYTDALDMWHPPMIVEAMPSGARFVPLGDDRWTAEHVFIRLDRQPVQVRREVAAHAMAMRGTPYGFSDYLSLALKKFGVRWGWLDRWISRTTEDGYPRRAICSQLVDAACTRAGIQVFNDGRLSQDVIPGALFYQLLRIGGTSHWPA